MKKVMSVLVLSGLMIAAVLAWGQVQRQTLPMASRTTDETKLEIARLKAEVDRLTKVVAEVDRLTKVIKVTDSSVRIQANLIELDGTIYLEGPIGMNYKDASHSVKVFSKAFFYQNVYGRQSEFWVF